jgi:hypothetical protein
MSTDSTLIIGLVYVAVALYMVWQQFWIASADGDDDRHWRATVALYKRHLRQVRWMGVALVIVVVVIVTLLLVPGIPFRDFAVTWIRLPYERESIPLMLAVAFTAALFSDWIDQAFELESQEAGAPAVATGLLGKIRRAGRTVRLRIGGSQRRWLYWFLVSIGLGVASEALFGHAKPDPVSWVTTRFAEVSKTDSSDDATTNPTTSPTTQPKNQKTESQPIISQGVAFYLFVRIPAILIAIGFTGALWLSYRAWVRTHIRKKMVEVHKFGPTVVPQFMKDYHLDDVPSQVIIIGPKRSGKSRAFQACGGRYVPDSTIPLFASYVEDQQNVRKLISIGDMPGENLGDHIYYVRTYRTNRLVIMVSAGAMKQPVLDPNTDPLQKPSTFSLENFGEACDPANPLGPLAREYFTALKLVLLRYNAPAQRSAHEYDVRSMTLLLNFNPAVPHEVAVKDAVSREGLSRLAAEIGQKLGIAEWYRVNAVVASVRQDARLEGWFAADTSPIDTEGALNDATLSFGGETNKLPRVFDV